MERTRSDEVRRAGKALLLGVILGCALLILGRRSRTLRRSTDPRSG